MFIAPPTRYIFIHSCLLRFLWFDPLGERKRLGRLGQLHRLSLARLRERDWRSLDRDLHGFSVGKTWNFCELVGFWSSYLDLTEKQWLFHGIWIGGSCFFQQLLDEIGVYIQIGSYWENVDNQSMLIWNIPIMLGWTQTIYHVFTMVHMFVCLTIEPFGENTIQNLSINNGQDMDIWPPNLWYIYRYNVPLVHHLI